MEEGLRVLNTVALEDAPGYVVPPYFRAMYDDPEWPCLVTLHVRVRRTGPPVVHVHLDPRLDQSPELWEEDGRRSQLELSPFDHMGRVPELPVQLLLRDVLRRVAMRAEEPFILRCGSRTGDMPELRVRRAPRTSHAEWKVIRRAYCEALADPECTTKYAVREYVFEKVHSAYPDGWPRGDGATPDYDRLRRFLDQIDRESVT